jgi:hypothetical protein
MKTTARVLCLVVLSALIGVAFLHTLSSASQVRDDEDKEANQAYYDCLIAELHNLMQKRFKDTDRGFGYRRIATVGDSPHSFRPENKEETHAIEQLKRASLEVTLYLSGRRVLGAKPEGDVWKRFAKNLIKGPLHIAGEQEGEDLFDRAELWHQGRRAMLAFKRSNHYEFSIGDWKFSARPVRAIDQSCLKCHTQGSANYLDLLTERGERKNESLKVGDPLGVILYGYRRSD